MAPSLRYNATAFRNSRGRGTGSGAAAVALAGGGLGGGYGPGFGAVAVLGPLRSGPGYVFRSRAAVVSRPSFPAVLGVLVRLRSGPAGWSFGTAGVPLRSAGSPGGLPPGRIPAVIASQGFRVMGSGGLRAGSTGGGLGGKWGRVRGRGGRAPGVVARFPPGGCGGASGLGGWRVAFVGGEVV